MGKSTNKKNKSQKAKNNWVDMTKSGSKKPICGKSLEVRLYNGVILHAKYWKTVGYVMTSPEIRRISWWDVSAWRYC